MELTNVPVNLFVLGDLVIDHFIPVTSKREHYQRAGDEIVVDGHPRKTIAGGAANCARLIAAVGHGKTCLWGLSGHSPWGSFVQILERSYGTGPTLREITYLGSHSDAHKMNTITRVIREDNHGARERLLRVDDVPKVPITENQERDAFGHLRAEHKTYRVHGIILNDLDMNGLSQSLVQEIAIFASDQGIPVFVDPKRDWSKYRQAHVTCALPNLREWCHIIGEDHNYDHWRTEIRASRSLEGIAQRCLQHMPNVDFHIITCDELGAILVAKADNGRRQILNIKAHPVREYRQQLGAGDVLVAALALEYAALGDHVAESTRRILGALEKANALVACYLGMDWQKVPTERDLLDFKMEPLNVSHTTQVTEAYLMLPPAFVRLDEHTVLGSGLVSIDETYHKTVKNLVTFLVGGWDNERPSSAILTGRGGLGKSEIIKILRPALAEVGVALWDNLQCSKESCPDVDSAVAAIGSYIADMSADGDDQAKCLVVAVDEAFTAAAHLLHGDQGKMLLQRSGGGKSKVRFLFIDADYQSHLKELSESQFRSRCREFSLPPLASRLGDIPYVFAAGCLKRDRTSIARISQTVLLKIFDWALTNARNPRQIADMAADVARDARAQNPHATVLDISNRHLPKDLRESTAYADLKKSWEFEWSNSNPVEPKSARSTFPASGEREKKAGGPHA